MPRGLFSKSISHKETDSTPLHKNAFRPPVRSDSPLDTVEDSRGSRRRSILEREHSTDGKNAPVRGVYRTCSERGSLSRKRARPGKFCEHCRPTLASHIQQREFALKKISEEAVLIAKIDAKDTF